MPIAYRKWLLKKRSEAGLSQADLGEAVGTTQTVVSAWETGKREVPLEFRRKIEEFLGEAYYTPKKKITAPLPLKSRGKVQDEDEEDEEEDEDEEDEEEDEDDEDDEDEEEDDEDGEDEARNTENQNPIGNWLRNERVKAGLSVPMLAQKASTSTAAIYHIEAGRSLNPGKSTLQKLENALGRQVPTSTAKGAAKERFVKDIGAIIDFNPYEKNSIPTCGGVYIFYDVSDRPIYVGQSKCIKNRIQQHSDKFWFKYPIVSYASYIEIGDTKTRTQIEEILIKFLRNNAVINSQHVKNKN
jgi:transcriptional regulator with XRE-family HTH domain